MPTVTHQQALDIAIAHHGAGRLAEAEEIYRQLIAIYPQNPDLGHLLGVIAHQAGRFDEALQLIQQAIAVNPGAYPYHNNLGLLLTRLGRREEAVAAFENAIRILPTAPEARYNLGITLGELGRAAEAVEAYRAALWLQPKHASARLNLGTALTMAGRADEALAHYRQVLAEDPGDASVAVNLGNLLKDLARMEEAVELYRTALRLTPDDPDAHSNLGVALKDCGEIDESLACYRRSLALDPLRPEIHSNLIYTSYFHPSIPQSEVVEEARRWDTLHAAPLRSEWRPHANDRSPDRRLRIGYISPDFRDHSVAFFLEPLLASHDPAEVEVFCYADVVRLDAVTARFRQQAAHWRSIVGMPDDQVADIIRQDGIDILVDLTGHTAHNRLMVFARKPAPVQVTWLGYSGSTGLSAIDYRFTDPQADPPGETEHFHTEELVRLPETFACFRPVETSPPVGPLPALARGQVTFASFHTLAKLHDQLLEQWAAILQQTPDSRLMMVAKGLDETPRRQRFLEFFARRGIGSERLVFFTRQSVPEYLALHHEVDLLLDSHPYSGHTIGCHALWMGVPVVTLAGQHHCARMVASVLTNVGLPELIAHTPEDYVRLAVELSADLPRLAQIRVTLRERMKNSPLLDAPRFARHFEAACRRAWRRWCVER